MAVTKPDDREVLVLVTPDHLDYKYLSSEQPQELRKRKFVEVVESMISKAQEQVPELSRSHFIVKAPHYLPSKWAYVDDSSKKVRKNYDYDCDEKPAGNQGEFSAAEKSKGKAESAGPEAKSIPQSQDSPPAKVSHTSTQTEVPPDNEQEKHTRFRVIPPGATGVTFDDIGGMDWTKELLQEHVSLPYQFGSLKDGLEPCKGILLYGPSGTGKTKFARAIATDARATFIDCSMSNLASLVPEEVEKNVRDLFTSAARVAPAIIFVENVDSMLAKRAYGEPVFMRTLKDEFMSQWDLMTKDGEQIIVLGTTNRPYDLDEAAIQRFELRVLFDLSSEEDREKILTIFLSKVKNEGIDFKELASETEGYTGSDLEILCKRAANLPLLELIKRRKKLPTDGFQTGEEQTITVRPLTMDDMMEAKKLVGTSVDVEGESMGELKKWYERYGKGGSGKKDQPLMFKLISKRLSYLM